MNFKTALVIIDVQIGAFDGKKIAPLENPDEFLGCIKRLLNVSREKGLPIFFVQDCGEVGGAFEKGTEHWPIHPNICPKEDESLILKTTGNAFEKTDLENQLNQLDIDQIIITGLHSEKCVTETFLEAIKKQYRVIIPQNAHSTISNKDRNFRDKISDQNLFFANHGADVVSVEELLERIN